MRLATLAALVSLIVGCAPLRAQQLPPAGAPVPPPSIVTSAQGEAKVTPDRAMIEISVQTRAATAAAAAAENARRQRVVLDTLRKMGLGADQLSTINYNVYPETRFEQGDREPHVIGYNVTNTIRAEVRRQEQVGPVIDASLAAGANMIGSLSLFAADSDTPRRAALGQAVAKARADADAMARAAGGSLGELLELSTAEMAAPPRPMLAMVARADAQQAPTPISPGQQTVMVSVVGRWRFVAGGR